MFELKCMAWDYDLKRLRHITLMETTDPHYEASPKYFDSTLYFIDDLVPGHRERAEVGLMIYTNAKDRNGMEIYSDSILEQPEILSDGQIMIIRGVVVWDPIELSWRLNRFYDSTNKLSHTLVKIDQTNCLMIGNIYAQPVAI